MKTSIKSLTLLLMAMLMAVSFASCSKDTDPTSTDFFIGTYKGSISYSSGDKKISTDNGKVVVSKVGDSYSFHFDNSIPDLTGVKFERKDDHTYISIGSGLTGITISKSSLTMLVVKDGATWTANCSR